MHINLTQDDAPDQHSFPKKFLHKKLYIFLVCVTNLLQNLHNQFSCVINYETSYSWFDIWDSQAAKVKITVFWVMSSTLKTEAAGSSETFVSIKVHGVTSMKTVVSTPAGV
jgi:hypothetical protein